ncbi:TIGR02922 family protein [Marinobacter hydrocarbonoclasticus]|nr:TIGR02922 family protein [Marinobacter nauticus]
MDFKDVTVLFFDSDESLVMKKTVLRGLPDNSSGRLRLPDHFREGKVIVAVLKGDVEVLSLAGDRI